MAEKREHWRSRLGIVLAASGSAVGLGSMWMLPYTMGQNGGGAFICLYLFFLLFLGLPLFICELLIGRRAKKSVTFAFETPKSSLFSSVGYLGVICTFLVFGWYAVVSGYGFQYLLMTLSDAFEGLSLPQVAQSFDTFRSAGDLNVLWQVTFLVAAGAIVSQGLRKGIEKFAHLLGIALLFVLCGLFVYSLSLPGFEKALAYIMMPDFSALTPVAVLKALSLSLFALSLGEGIMVTYGSYISDEEDLPKTALIVVFATFFISILMALIIFPIVFTLGIEPSAGEGLIFKSLPFAFNALPGGVLVGLLFFSVWIMAALTSAIGQLEVLVAHFGEKHSWSRKKAVVVSLFGCFLIGLPIALSNSNSPIFPQWKTIFQLTYFETNLVLIDFLLCLFALFTALFVGFKLKKEDVRECFEKGSKLRPLFRIWYFLLKTLVPLCILMVLLHQAKLL